MPQYPRQQANQCQVVIVAVAVIIWMEEDLIDGILLLIFFRDKRMIVSYSNLILLGGIAIPAEIRRIMFVCVCQ